MAAMRGITPSRIDFDKLENDFKGITDSSGGKASQAPGAKTEFLDMLENGIKEVNTASKEAEKAGMDLASGKSSNVHETMLAMTKAELGFDMMVQMRNKAIEAYQEVMRMQV